jgi:hypothetical protein
MRPRKKDESGCADSDFPPEDWFGGIDDYFYPVGFQEEGIIINIIIV